MHNFSQTGNRHAHRTVAVAAMLTYLFVATASAQESRRGVYVGLTNSARLDSSVSAVTNPTKCDKLLYASPALAPSSAPECMDTTPRALSSNGFSPGYGFTGGLSVGYAYDELRIEAEYRARTHGGDVSPIIESTTNQAMVSKALEWSPVSCAFYLFIRAPRT